MIMVTMQELKDQIQVTDIPLTEKTFKKEGVDNLDEYVRQIAAEKLESILEQQMASTNFFPTRLDPKIYDQGTLYGWSPALTYLENKGRRKATGDTKVQYIKWTAGFTPEWIQETDSTSGGGTGTSSTATASMKFIAMPISLSDLIGQGASAGMKAQIMQFAMQGLREDFNAKIVAGDKDTNYQFDGLDTIALDSGTRTNLSTANVTVEDLNTAETTFRDTVKGGSPTVIFTSNAVVDQLKKDMMATVNTVNTTEAIAGVTVPAYASNTGNVPIIADPNVPKTGNQRRLDMFNEQHIMIEDFMTPTYVMKGKAKPFATDGWLVQVSVLYDVAPALNVQLYNIA
jgi:hypothetical protein